MEKQPPILHTIDDVLAAEREKAERKRRSLKWLFGIVIVLLVIEAVLVFTVGRWVP